MRPREDVMNAESLERVYSNYASVYDQTFGKVFNESRESAVRGLPIAPEDNVLEVGVGTGMALPLYPNHCQVTGIDLSEGMLKKAQARIIEHQLDHVSLHRMDAGKMEFEDDSFDIVMVNSDGAVLQSNLLNITQVNVINSASTGIVGNNETTVVNNPVVAAAQTTWELFTLLTGTYVFNVLVFFGVPEIFVTGLVILYVILLEIT